MRKWRTQTTKVNIGAFSDVKKAVSGGGGGGEITHLHVNNNRNESSNFIFYAMIMMTWFTPCSWPPEEGTHGNSWWGVCRPVPRILTLFQTKNCHFPHPFSDQISKIHTNFQTWSILACSRLSDGGGVSQFPPVLFSCSRFLNSVDPTISEPGTD